MFEKTRQYLREIWTKPFQLNIDGAIVSSAPDGTVTIIEDAPAEAKRALADWRAGLRVREIYEVSFTYTNWRGKTGKRQVVVSKIVFGNTPWHIGDQFFIFGYDLQRCEQRYFAMKDISNFKVEYI